MTIIYRFKKEKLESGKYVSRPRIDIILHGKDMSIEVPALVDSGCDTTVIPEGIARAIGLGMEGERDKLYAFREESDVIISKANFTFVGKRKRQSEQLNNLPILIVLEKENRKEEDIVLGLDGIFDAFDITFKKKENRIVFKRSSSKLW